MKILLTGSNGMVGKNIIEQNLDDSLTFLTPSKKELNLNNYNLVCDYIKKNKPSFIVHAAGVVGGIIFNMNNQAYSLTENMNIGLNIVNAAKNNNVKNFINISSSCIYPRNLNKPIHESELLSGYLEPTNEGYAIAKIAMLKLCNFISHDKSLNYKTVIPCNLFGKYDHFDENNSHLIPSLIKRIHEAKTSNIDSIKMWGDGSARREFMYASDFGNFIQYAIKNFSMMPLNLNVGLGYDYSIQDYYEKVAEVINYSGKFIKDNSMPVGMKNKLIDSKELKKFGWTAKTDLTSGILQTFNYYKKNVIK